MTRFKLPQRHPRQQPDAEQQARAAQAEAIERLRTALWGPRTEPDEDEEADP